MIPLNPGTAAVFLLGVGGCRPMTGDDQGWGREARFEHGFGENRKLANCLSLKRNRRTSTRTYAGPCRWWLENAKPPGLVSKFWRSLNKASPITGSLSTETYAFCATKTKTVGGSSAAKTPSEPAVAYRVCWNRNLTRIYGGALPSPGVIQRRQPRRSVTSR